MSLPQFITLKSKNLFCIFHILFIINQYADQYIKLVICTHFRKDMFLYYHVLEGHRDVLVSVLAFGYYYKDHYIDNYEYILFGLSTLFLEYDYTVERMNFDINFDPVNVEQ